MPNHVHSESGYIINIDKPFRRVVDVAGLDPKEIVLHHKALQKQCGVRRTAHPDSLDPADGIDADTDK